MPKVSAALLWTRDVERRLFDQMARDLALSATEKTPLSLSIRLRIRLILRQFDTMLLVLAVAISAHVRWMRRVTWVSVRSVRVDRVVHYLTLWFEWMAFMLVTHFVAGCVMCVIR